MVIVGIDAGHGGTNTGTQAGGLMEKRITLSIAAMLRVAMILKSGKIYPVMIREDDETLTQSQRGKRSRDLKCDFVISLHLDSRFVGGEPDPSGHGLVCYHLPGDKVARRVSRAIVKACPEELATNDHPIWTTARDWRKDAHAVVSAHDAPTVLVEVAFASDPIDAEIIQAPEAQAGLVNAFVEGLSVGLA
jgi:N-acetylmuramoyl-L-alanine amidase